MKKRTFHTSVTLLTLSETKNDSHAEKDQHVKDHS